MKFTPGPWRENPQAEVTGYADVDNQIVGADGCDVATCYGIRELQPHRHDLPLVEQARANARLIAAAPDMYEALVLIEKSLNGQTGPVSSTIRTWCADAIAKVQS